MNPEIFLLALIGLLLFGAGIFILGREFGVRRWHRQDRQRDAAIIELDDRLNTFNEKAEQDPQRTYINHGQNYVLNRVETLTNKIREEMKD